ncbi:MAG: hypothetical protein WCB53_00535 [Terriglobales bacterium]
MKRVIGTARIIMIAALGLIAFLPVRNISAQTLASRLILKDGTYQSVTKYEVHGDRVRYFSAERGEWEEVPNSLIDWDATKKYEEGRSIGGSIPEAADLDKEIEAERKAALVRTPEVAPGLRLSDEGGVYLLDTYQNGPELAEIQQSGSDLNRSKGANILRAAINPFSGSKQNIELPDAHAKVQAHTAVPSLYINVGADTAAGAPVVATGAEEMGRVPADSQPIPASERFKIIRVETKGNKRVAGAVKVAVTGKTKTDERFIPSTVTEITGGWIKVTPIDPLAAGEYAVAEMLGKESINLYVWDFGVNPNAPANAFAVKPEAPEAQKDAEPKPLEKREKQQ